MKAFLGIVTIDTLEYDGIIVARAVVERATREEALADAREMLPTCEFDEREAICDPRIGFLVYD